MFNEMNFNSSASELKAVCSLFRFRDQLLSPLESETASLSSSSLLSSGGGPIYDTNGYAGGVCGVSLPIN